MALAVALAASLSAPADEKSAVEERLLHDVKTLADDGFEGRGVGTDGLNRAADYVAEVFSDAGLQVNVDGGDPFQEFEITTGAELTTPNLLTLTAPVGEAFTLEYDSDFRTCSFGESGEFSGEIVFCGYGIESDQPAYSDFADVDVKGKIVVIMRRNPQQGKEDGMFAVAHGQSRHAGLTTKISRAFQRGAAAVLLVNDPYTGRRQRQQLEEELAKARDRVVANSEAEIDAGEDGEAAALARVQLAGAVKHLRQVREMLARDNRDPLIDFGYGGTRGGRSLPVMHITQAVCNRMLENALGKTLEQIESEIDETGRPQSAVLTNWTGRGQTSLKPIRVGIKNVIGVLEGEGPLAEETVIIGAHYDHVGMGGEGSLAPGSHEVHNGADDNASGTAGLLEIARRLGRREQKLPRRIVFLAFTGEERGLLGSAHYVKEPVFPLDKTIAMINMDMIGRLEGDRLTVFGTGTAPVWNDWLDPAAEATRLQLARKPEGFGPSDHASFYAKRIPVLHLFTGTHSDYHRPSDDWDKINYAGMTQVIDLVESLVVRVAETAEPPQYVEVQGRASIERDGSRPYFGSIPDFSSDADGYAIQGVAPGSPAETAGVKGGDVLIRLGGNQIGGLDDFDLALRKFSAGQEVEVVVRRDGQEVPLKVTLAKPRS
jgi:hypothetical protein